MEKLRKISARRMAKKGEFLELMLLAPVSSAQGVQQKYLLLNSH